MRRARYTSKAAIIFVVISLLGIFVLSVIKVELDKEYIEYYSEGVEFQEGSRNFE